MTVEVRDVRARQRRPHDLPPRVTPATRLLARGRRALTVGAPAIAVVGIATAGLLAAGVPASVVFRFELYWAGFIAGPGVLCAAVLLPRRGPLYVFAVGAALGYALEVLAWMLTAWSGSRGLLWAYPPVVAALTVPWLRRRSVRRRALPAPAPVGPDEEAPCSLPATWSWAVAGCCLFTLAAVVVWYWSASPWPVTGPATWSVDLGNQLGWAADAMHHFPPSDPSVSGVTQRYHWFFYGHLASAASITGIELPWLVFRLYLVPLLLLVPVLLALTASRLSGRPWAGPVAALTGTVAAELSISTVRTQVAYGGFSAYAFYSPTYLYGLLFFCALLLVSCDQFRDGVRTNAWWIRWLAVAILLVGAAGAKLPVVPLLAAGFGLAAAYALHRRRPLWVGPVIGATLAAIAFGLAQLTLYGGSSPARVRLDYHLLQWQTVAMSAVGRLLDPHYTGIRPTLLEQVLGLPFAFAILLAPFLGALALARVPRNRVSQVFLLGIMIGGISASSLVVDPAHSEHWFLVMALPAGAILGGWGTALLLDRITARRAARWTVGALTAAAAVLVFGLGLNTMRGDTPGRFVERYAIFAVVALVATVLAALALRLRPTAAAAFTVAMVLGGCLAGVPLKLWQPVRAQLTDGRQVLPEDIHRKRPDVTPELMAALEWIRGNTRSDDVVAVNNHCLAVSINRRTKRLRCDDHRVFYYSGFSERRYLIESWSYTDELLAVALRAKAYYPSLPSPFPQRTALNDRAFTNPTPAVLDALYLRYGVRYLLVDARPSFRGGPPFPVPPQLKVLATEVFHNEDAGVYRLRRPSPRQLSIVR